MVFALCLLSHLSSIQITASCARYPIYSPTHQLAGGRHRSIEEQAPNWGYFLPVTLLLYKASTVLPNPKCPSGVHAHSGSLPSALKSMGVVQRSLKRRMHMQDSIHLHHGRL